MTYKDLFFTTILFIFGFTLAEFLFSSVPDWSCVKRVDIVVLTFSILIAFKL